MRTAVEAGRRGSPGRYFIEAVGKAIEVMWAFHGKPEGLTIDEVVVATGIAKSSGYRILCTLIHAEMLATDPDQGRYLISSRFFQLDVMKCLPCTLGNITFLRRVVLQDAAAPTRSG